MLFESKKKILKYKKQVKLVKSNCEKENKSLLLHHRTNVLCCKERSSQIWKYSNSKVRGKYSSRFYSAMITATRKVPSPFLSVVTES